MGFCKRDYTRLNFTVHGTDTGVICATGGKLRGGNSAFAFIGSYADGHSCQGVDATPYRGSGIQPVVQNGHDHVNAEGYRPRRYDGLRRHRTNRRASSSGGADQDLRLARGGSAIRSGEDDHRQRQRDERHGDIACAIAASREANSAPPITEPTACRCRALTCSTTPVPARASARPPPAAPAASNWWRQTPAPNRDRAGH